MRGIVFMNEKLSWCVKEIGDGSKGRDAYLDINYIEGSIAKLISFLFV